MAADGQSPGQSLSHLFSPSALRPIHEALVATVPAARRAIGDDDATRAAECATARANDVLVTIFERLRSPRAHNEVLGEVLTADLLNATHKRLGDASKCEPAQLWASGPRRGRAGPQSCPSPGPLAVAPRPAAPAYSPALPPHSVGVIPACGH